jgi:hypothetical protein
MAVKAILKFVTFVFCILIFSCERSFKENDFMLLSWDLEKDSNMDIERGISYKLSLLKLNNKNETKMKDLNTFLNVVLYGGLTADEYLKNGSDYALNSYIESMKDDGIGWYYGEEFEYDIIKRKYLTIKRKFYGGGGSGFEDAVFFVLDLNEYKIISYDDIFIGGSNKILFELIKNQLMLDKDYINWNLDVFRNLSNIYLLDDGLRFYWVEGSYGANAYGSKEITINYSQFKFFLTPLGKKLFK